MADETAERKRAEEMAESLKHDTLPNIMESLPTSAGVSSAILTPASNPVETKLVRCFNCLQEVNVPADAKEFTCKVCSELNTIGSTARPGTIHTG